MSLLVGVAGMLNVRNRQKIQVDGHLYLTIINCHKKKLALMTRRHGNSLLALHIWARISIKLFLTFATGQKEEFSIYRGLPRVYFATRRIEVLLSITCKTFFVSFLRKLFLQLSCVKPKKDKSPKDRVHLLLTSLFFAWWKWNQQDGKQKKDDRGAFLNQVYEIFIWSARNCSQFCKIH